MNPDEPTGDLRLDSPDRPSGTVPPSPPVPPPPVRTGPPPRTRAVAVLDAVLGVGAAIRGAFVSGPARPGTSGGVTVGRWSIGVGVVAGAAAVLSALVLLIVLVLRTPDDHVPLNVAPPAEVGVGSSADPGTPGSEASPNALRTGAPDAEAVPPAGLPARPENPAGTATGSPSVAPPPPAPPAGALTAVYTIGDATLVGYRVTVTIDNPNPAPTPRWTVTITLPRPAMTVREVTGAEVTQDGTTWTFVPAADTGPAPAGGSVSFRFRVDGVGVSSAPTACTIDGRPCTTG
ncbi:cellulose binding domain-containing protein [Micromonospora sp. NBC_01796]|uniref:cellulose binding domain-containing protein n=1 Tax=Micromonospora sp. NBC_01796 TaxID=2975987 RepID=UPI002DDC3E0B|nr:cellulose binding domain-containing protein [Micromonospora sp. NBC_01796]WSA83096.1 cellulose-binding domain-containing protein [Micromonospora sp. NBC_01796]